MYAMCVQNVECVDVMISMRARTRELVHVRVAGIFHVEDIKKRKKSKDAIGATRIIITTTHLRRDKQQSGGPRKSKIKRQQATIDG